MLASIFIMARCWRNYLEYYVGASNLIFWYSKWYNSGTSIQNVTMLAQVFRMIRCWCRYSEWHDFSASIQCNVARVFRMIMMSTRVFRMINLLTQVFRMIMMAQVIMLVQCLCRVPDKMRKINFNRLYLFYFFTKSYICLTTSKNRLDETILTSFQT